MSALLWGATVPFSKRVLATGVNELEAGGLLYLGAALGLTLILFVRGVVTKVPSDGAISGRELRYLLAAAIIGGFAAPWLAMLGQARTSGMSAALLLNLELPATTVIAILVFKERVSRALLVGGALVLGGALIIGIAAAGASSTETSLAGALAMAGSCLCWGIDNNVTTQVARLDSLRVARWKGAAAAPLSLALAWLVRGAPLWRGAWTASTIMQMLIIGLVGYGIGLACIVRAFRELGAARTGALFATAPFVGALATIPVLGERPTITIGAAGALMATGVFLLTRERPPA
jgi:drug/metabolite transporter (DMT)-like permease